MRLHVIGCHGPFPPANGATSGYLIEHENHLMLMDCGSGVLGKLTALCDPGRISCVLLSHLHFDHMADLLVLQYYLQRIGKKIPVYVPPEDSSLQQKLLTPPAFDVRPFPERLEWEGLSVTTFPVRHPVPCRAIRITDGMKTLVFTGDTNDCEGLAEFARNTDTLLADAAFLRSEWNENLPHMSAAGAAALAKQAGAGKLLLTHLPVQHEKSSLEKEAKAIFEPVAAVFPGWTVEI